MAGGATMTLNLSRSPICDNPSGPISSRGPRCQQRLPQNRAIDRTLDTRRKVADQCRRGSESTRAPIPAFPLVVFFAALMQVKMQAPPSLLVFPDMLVHAGSFTEPEVDALVS
jgi:hypothetical protein